MSLSLNNNVVQVNNTQPIKQPQKKTDEKTKLLTPTQTNVAIGTGLTVLAAIGIYIATKGKGSKTAHEVQESANTIKEMTVEAFKQAGNKFNRGKAVTSTGEAFTGNITHQTNDGKNIVREYENGVLKKSTKYDGENILSQKIYKYGKDGDLFVVQDGKLILNKITDTKNGLQTFNTEKGLVIKNTNTGKIKSLQLEGQGRKDFYYDDNGTLKAVKIQNNHHTNTIFYSPDGNKNMRVQNDGWVEFYDKKGVPTDKIQVDITGENPFLQYADLSYNELRVLGNIDKTYSYVMPQGTSGNILRQTRVKGGKKEIRTNLVLTTPDKNTYFVSKNGKDIQIKRSVDKKKREPIAKDSDEYKNVLAQSNDFMKQFLSKYKTALGLQRQVNEALQKI